MSNVFNFNRFLKYQKYDLKCLTTKAGMMLLLTALFPIIFYLLYTFFHTLFTGNLLNIFSNELEFNGPSIGVRFAAFIVILTIFLIMFPERTYGHVTNKAAGSAWLMIPASRLEKFTSMMINCLIIIPIVFVIIYLASDALTCLFDKTCGVPILSKQLFGENGILPTGDDNVSMVLKGIPFLWINIIETVIMFLLGALCFKKWKILGTIFCAWVIGLVWSVVFGIMFAHADWLTFGESIQYFVYNHIDSINLYINGLINIIFAAYVLILGGGAWLRLKTLQH